MAIGMSSLIPLYRVQPDPEARFQRFGVNDSQLFGKALVTFGSGAPAAQPRKTEDSPSEESYSAKPQENRFDKTSALTQPEPTYGPSKGTGTGLGSFLDVMA